jgi:hypothetical protein
MNYSCYLDITEASVDVSIMNKFSEYVPFLVMVTLCDAKHGTATTSTALAFA